MQTAAIDRDEAALRRMCARDQRGAGRGDEREQAQNDDEGRSD